MVVPSNALFVPVTVITALSLTATRALVPMETGPVMSPPVPFATVCGVVRTPDVHAPKVPSAKSDRVESTECERVSAMKLEKHVLPNPSAGRS